MTVLADAYAIKVATGVPPTTLRTWARLGHIGRHGTRAGRTLFDLAEVEARVEEINWKPRPPRRRRKRLTTPAES